MTVALGSGLHSHSNVSINKVLLANNSNTNLVNSSINVLNVREQGMFNIGFNSNNTFKITKEWSETNTYYTGNNSLIVIIRNSKGKILYNETFKGGAYPENTMYDAFNGKPFQYGDTIQ
ncbi:MAG: hypothetical protein ACRCT3_08890 [Aeromonas hydrophila]